MVQQPELLRQLRLSEGAVMSRVFSALTSLVCQMWTCACGAKVPYGKRCPCQDAPPHP